MKLQENRKQSLEGSQEKVHLTYPGTMIHFKSDISSETMQAGRNVLVSVPGEEYKPASGILEQAG